MHRHDQGLQEGCRWCDLDLLLRELAGDVGLLNLIRYMTIEFDVMVRREEELAKEFAEAAAKARHEQTIKQLENL